MIELKNINKTISSKQVLRNITYNFDYGKVYGLYGINGSGKTMLMRAIAGLVVIENMQLLPKYNAFDNLKLLSKIRKTATDDDIRLSLKRVGLETDIKVKKFSLGMKQRLNIAQAIFEHQNIIMLDEPTNALDDKGVKLIYDIIREERERGAFVLISTHHKEDLKETCDIILNVSEGMISED